MVTDEDGQPVHSATLAYVGLWLLRLRVPNKTHGLRMDEGFSLFCAAPSAVDASASASIGVKAGSEKNRPADPMSFVRHSKSG